MLSRRDFISKTALTAGFFTFAGSVIAKEKFKHINSLTPSEAATDEDFWSWVRESYTASPNIINLNNAGISPQPKVVQDAAIENYRFCNETPSYHMWQLLDKGREPLRAKIAELAGCLPEEIAFNRNSTEGLNTIIMGLNLKAGDEVVLGNYDYPHMKQCWQQRERREGIKLVWIDDFDFPVEDDQKIVDTYAKAITSKTKIVHITHLINWSGQIVPARKIADMAHSKGCEVILDGAQSFAHVDYKIPDLGCDYYATSLHKWLCAPFGSGMMYIKKDKIKNVWTLLGDDADADEKITKFEWLGTRSFATEMAIGNAADFHMAIGAARKEARLRYLKDYWYTKVKDVPGIKLYTSMKPEYACTIAVFGIAGWKAGEITTKLFDEYKIHTTPIEWKGINGTRISPNVYTSLYDLDRLVKGITEIAKATPPVRTKS
ncbi:MAG TPA: aminotransferase class V-fold PLP-dependent enzyme [Bacteroidia bacterium]|jgi:selenocysteine lyase/cysteine desulfurase|nr:aminotransferase class V-fold PLP-dependent enzyme [Bacteroidia bacterium]